MMKLRTRVVGAVAVAVLGGACGTPDQGGDDAAPGGAPAVADDPGNGGAGDSGQDGSDPVDGPAQATGGQVPANEAEVIAAAAYDPPWVEVAPRDDGASGWVNDVLNFPEDAGFEPSTPEQEAEVVADGFVAQRNRQFEILGPDAETGSDDAYAGIRVVDFGTPDQAAAAARKAHDAALGRTEGASALETGLQDVLGSTWTYSIAKCTPVGGTFDCQDEPPWTVYRLTMSTDRFAVVIEHQWPSGGDEGPDDALRIASLLREVFAA